LATTVLLHEGAVGAGGGTGLGTGVGLGIGVAVGTGIGVGNGVGDAVGNSPGSHIAVSQGLGSSDAAPGCGWDVLSPVGLAG
jgi:hypothetical protein